MTQLPPGPAWPMPLQTFLAIFLTERFNEYIGAHFDGIVTLRIAGLGEVVSTGDPELVKAIFNGDPEAWVAGEANAKFLQAPAGPSSVLVIDGSEHLRMRRLLLPPFHGEAVRAHAELIARVAAEEVARWPLGEELALHPRMQAITLEVILRAVIGVRDERRLQRLRGLLGHIAGANLFAFWAEGAHPRLAAGPLASRLPWIAARREADALIHEEIAAHRADPDGREDVLAMLIAARGEETRDGRAGGRALSDAELRDQVATLLVAGHETIATALAWCFERLVRNPRCLSRLREEIAADGGEDYLEAVVNETLRVRPVVDQAVRKLKRPTELGGYTLPRGTFVAASILAVHLSQQYEDPEEFRPERFLGRPAPPYALIPFGGGVRRCVGASFAVMEMKTILRTVLERIELRAARSRPERPIRWRRFTVSPSRGARVVVSARREPAAAQPRPRREPLTARTRAPAPAPLRPPAGSAR